MNRPGATAPSTAAAALRVALSLALVAAAGAPAVRRGEKDVLGPAVARALENSRLRTRQQHEWWPIHSTWQDPWIVTSEHYQVKQTRAYWVGRRIADGLEQMWPHFEDVLVESTPRSEPFLVEIHPDLPSYNRVGATVQDDATAYHTSFLGSFHGAELPGGPVVTYDPGDEETLVRQITHSAAHQYLAAFGRPAAGLPSWLVEGVAGFLEMVQNPSYGERQRGHFRSMMERGAGLPLSRLTALTPEQWNQALIQQAALLVHFLWNEFEETADVRGDDGALRLRGPFREWWAMKVRGEDVGQHPVDALLRDELVRLDEEFRRWVRS